MQEHKKGYFFALVLLAKLFRENINAEALVALTLEETKAAKAVKSSEKHHLALGRLLGLSAAIDAGLCS